MGRILITLLLVIVCINVAIAQCPDLPNNTTVNGSPNTSIEMCGAMSALFEVNDPNLPSGTIDWYSSTASGFDPLVSGTFLGASNIDSADPCDPGGCPGIEVIYIDACGPGDESLNEFMVISSGSGFAVDDLSLTFDPNNTFGGAGNGNVNVGGACAWMEGDLSNFSGCTSLIAVGPGDYIPPNSAVIIQTSNANFATTVYDVSAMCGVSDCIYVLSNSCDRGVGAFSNCGGGTGMGSTRTNQIALTCGCTDVLIYDILDPNFVDVCNNIGNNGMHVFADLTYANNTCNSGPNLGSISQFNFSAITDNFTHSFTDAECNTTQYVVGVLNSSQFNTECCAEQLTEEYAFDIACITAELQGVADLCPGECAEITVLISGGEPPYNLNLSLMGLPFPFDNIMIPFVGFPVDEKITICFDNGGPLIDPANFTIDVPGLAAGFSGSLTLNSISDDNGCAGTINGSSISVAFNEEPDINNPGDQEACDLGDGTGIFILGDLTNTINGGTGATVNYYSDLAGTMPIMDPYTTSGGPIYAQVMGTPCNSEIIEINLNVIANGDAGSINFLCTNADGTTSDECTICDDDGVLGEEINLSIFFENPGLNYEYEVLWTEESGASSTITGSGIGMGTVTFTITETTTFAITVVTADGDCPDMTDLGDIITMNYSLQPDIDQPQDLSDCGSVTLPEITGSDIPSNAAYYSDPGGMGTMFDPGDEISTSTTLFLYAGVEGCDVEYEFDVTIEEQAIIDDPEDVVTCGVFSVPPITGTNVENAAYYTDENGGGDEIAVGTIISTSTILYLFDDNCGGNQPTLDITITPGPIITNNTDTIVCEMYIVEPITGIDLSGNEIYLDTINGSGFVVNVGDTITQDSIIFIFDNTNGCEVQIPIFIDIREPGNPGLDTAIVLCEGDPTLININEALGGVLPDTGGKWLDINNTGIISDSTQVDFSSLTSGIYLYEYQIMDSICVDTHSVLTVNIITSPNAGMDASLTICGDTTGIDVFSLLGNPDTGGAFFDELNMVATFDPTDASFDASNADTSVYSYVVGNPGSSCGADTSLFTVIVDDEVSAGDDNSISVCAGVVVDLTTLLMNNSEIGRFNDPIVSGGLIMGDKFDTDAVDDGTYTILHIVDGSGSCPSDTALLTITITDGASAGDENSIQLCGDSTLVLSDLINGDPGGQFHFNDSPLPSDEISYTDEVGTFIYYYIVGDGMECPFDSAELTVTRSIKPPSTLDITLENLCDEDCTTVSFNAPSLFGQIFTVFYHIESNTGEIDNRSQVIAGSLPDIETTFCVGVGDLTNNILQPGQIYTFMLDSILVDAPNCTFPDGLSVSFSTFAAVESIDTSTHCLSDIVSIGDDTYDVNNPSGTTIITNGSVSGCDSVITVDLNFQDFAEGEFSRTACLGDTVVFPPNGMIYTESVMDDFIIVNGSISGCDSLVHIEIEFLEPTFDTFDDTVCSGDTIQVNGEDFYLGKLSGTQILEGANAVGCDSIVQVLIEILDPATSTFTGDFCSSYFIEINNVIYDISNPSGEEVLLNEAANGCDSIVTIDLTFNQQDIDSTFIFSTCDDSYSVQIGNMVFDSSMTSGQVMLTSDEPGTCDTIINVALTFGELGVFFDEIDGSCEVPDSGFVIITEVSSPFPIDLFYNGNNAKIFNLPFELELPVGNGEITVMDNEGCEAVISYELFSGEENFTIDENQGQLNVSGGTIDSIAWSPIEGLSCTNCVDPIAQPTQSTTYFATVFYGDSCMIELSIDVIVIDNTPDYVLPSVFSPNGDNSNDNFILTITTGAIGIPQGMRIYDRWGNLMFTGVGEDLIQNGWDGTKDGRDVMPGVYVYQVTILENEELVTLYGDVTLIR
ncbi:MAG: gliding motility-associated C-terminal domain-containing protein [Bacteroidota bacterium]